MITDDLSSIVDAIDPADVDYQTWVNVGMVLRDSGHSVHEWDEWSRRDTARYRDGETLKKWQSFQGSRNPVGVGTLVMIAKEHGWQPTPSEGFSLEWGDEDDIDALNAALGVTSATNRHGTQRSTDAQEEDNLGEPVFFTDAVREGLPALSPPLIDGVLRQGHKLMLAGGSKASKSYALIGLAVAIAEGREWLGWQCTQGRVMYLNLEVDGASCLDRFDAVHRALGVTPSPQNLSIWNLRGKAMAMQNLTPKLIDRARRISPVAIVIDPIYKVVSGDENSAGDMGKFCNELDKLADGLGCAIITCHHHSKGAQGQKTSHDRASGSGVFARDADALLDFIELDKTAALLEQQINEAECTHICAYLDTHGPAGWREDLAQDVLVVANDLRSSARGILDNLTMETLIAELAELDEAVREYKALRVAGTLREFRSFQPRNIWFRHPIHELDATGALRDLQAHGEKRAGKSTPSREQSSRQRAQSRSAEIENAFEVLAIGTGEVSLMLIAEYLGVTPRTVRTRVDEHEGFAIENAMVKRAPGGEVK